MKKIFYLMFILSISYSQTVLSGSVEGILPSEGNPYIIAGDIYCDECVFDAGVEINVTPGGHTIMYNGTFTINGTVINPVIIQSNSGVSGSWGGITNQGDSSNDYLTSFDEVNINYLIIVKIMKLFIY